MTDFVPQMTEDEFDAALAAADSRPLLAYFRQDDCPPCVEMTEPLAAMAERLAGRMRMACLNQAIDEETQELQTHPLHRRYPMTAMPLFALFASGRPVLWVCEEDAAALEALLTDVLDALEGMPLPPVPGWAVKTPRERTVHLPDPSPAGLTLFDVSDPEETRELTGTATIPAGEETYLQVAWMPRVGGPKPDYAALSAFSGAADHLTLSDEELDDEKMDHVLELTGIRSARIYVAKLTPVGVRKLAGLSGVASIYLLGEPGPAIDEALQYVREALPDTIVQDRWAAAGLTPLLQRAAARS
ncbi:thioredoxin family protein [Amycolatopsis jejuensis]|uniref:thioredoxin family protein n=1 Tax=Amycolatopsis jejuensis TaxID=330084 RepID=UPI000524751C|nr:thioredoxin family protein [Amycolatopsis jejuensis]